MLFSGCAEKDSKGLVSGEGGDTMKRVDPKIF